MTPAPSPRLNTQPKGTTCEDCQRFRKEECPYPESNITITRCNSFLMDVEAHDTHIRTTIRNATLEPLKATYNKFKCLDKILSDVAGKCGEAKTATMLEVAGEMWQAIKESLRTKEQP